MAQFEDAATAQSVSDHRQVPLISTPQVTLETICNFLTVGPDDVACDIGCGLGGFCVEAAKRGAKAIGLDIHEEYLQQAQSNAIAAGVADRCTFLQCDFRAPDFEIPLDVTALYLYLLPWALEMLEPAVRRALSRGCRLVTFHLHNPNLTYEKCTLFGALKLYTGSSVQRPRPAMIYQAEADDEDSVENTGDHDQSFGSQSSPSSFRSHGPGPQLSTALGTDAAELVYGVAQNLSVMD